MSAERDLLNKALSVLLELKDCSDSWCEYYVPIGIHYRIDEAIQELLAQPEHDLKREPLSDEKIMILGVQNLCNEANSFKPFGFARAIEKAHGIGGGE